MAAVGTLLKRHLVLFVVLRDEELEALAGAEPRSPTTSAAPSPPPPCCASGGW